MRKVFYYALIALAFCGAFRMEQERVRVMMEVHNDSR